MSEFEIAHVWPAELTPDAACLHCGLPYGEFTVQDAEPFTDVELYRADELARLARLPSSVTTTQVAALVRVLEGQQDR